MPNETRTVAPGPDPGSVRVADGSLLSIPPDWILVLPGDAALTRRIKSTGPCWMVKEKKGRRVFSKGIWTDAQRVESIRSDLESERSTDAYAKRRVADAKRRETKQALYVDDFREAVVAFLDFAEGHKSIARKLADAVSNHATPVGSGTVARTQRIPIERRAESAVIAWMRHQTTAYDQMKIARVKGKRRETRRMLAEKSRILLESYRSGAEISSDCPLYRALNSTT